MSVELNIQNDFATILDGVELITLKRRDSAATITIVAAWRFSSRITEPEPAGGHVAQADVVWQFPWSGANEMPRLGDSLIDAVGNCYTVLSVEQLSADTRLRCTTRNLAIVYQLTDRVNVQQALIEDTGGGPEIVGWKTVRAALPARIQPQQMTVVDSSTPATATETFRILLGEPMEAAANMQFVDPQGNVYQLVEFEQIDLTLCRLRR